MGRRLKDAPDHRDAQLVLLVIIVNIVTEAEALVEYVEAGIVIPHRKAVRQATKKVTIIGFYLL